MNTKIDIKNMDEKKLRNLRINLNNRLTSFKKGGKIKDLSQSHKLHGLSEDECTQLLLKVREAEKKSKS